MRAITLRRAAQRDIEAAVAWYDDQAPGLGLRLLDAIGAVVARLAQSPEQFPVVRPGVRRALTSGFPYAVYFKATQASVVVLAVMHLRRRPGTWRRKR